MTTPTDPDAEIRRYLADKVEALIDERDALREIDRLNTDQMRRDAALIATLRETLAALQDVTSNIPGHHGPSVWRAIEDARQALEQVKP